MVEGQATRIISNEGLLTEVSNGALHVTAIDGTGSTINPSTEDKQDDIITSINALKVTITNAIEESAYDLNAAAFNETTNINNDFILDNIEFNFSTTESKTITITSSNGTTIWQETNTFQSIYLSNMNIGCNGSDNITISVTQFSSPGTMDCILRIRQGSESLYGDPILGAGSNIIGKVNIVDNSGNDVNKPLIQYIEDAGGSITYIGEAQQGSATSDSAWRIKKVDESGSPTTITLSANYSSFGDIWDNRAAGSYT